MTSRSRRYTNSKKARKGRKWHPNCGDPLNEHSIGPKGATPPKNINGW